MKKNFIKKVTIFPLSNAQKRLWVLYRLDDIFAAFNVHNVLVIDGALNITALEKALNFIVKRHDILRTNFHEFKGAPAQVILPFKEFKQNIIDIIDGNDYLAVKKNEADFITKIINTKFKLESDKLYRFVLIRKSRYRYLFIIVFHHIIFDGESMGIFYKELSDLYHAFIHGIAPNLPGLPIQYKDYAEWEESVKNRTVVKKQEKYWLKRFSGFSPSPDLPYDFSQPQKINYYCEVKKFTISSRQTSKIKKFCQDNNITLFIYLFVAFNVFLSKISNKTEHVVGTLAASRRVYEISHLIGYFVNTLAIRSNINDNMKFSELLEINKVKIMNDFDNQEFSFDSLLEKLKLSRDGSRPTLFNSIFQFDQAPGKTGLNFFGIKVKTVSKEEPFDQFDFRARAGELNDGRLLFRFFYNTGLFRSETISNLIEIFRIILKQIVEQPTIIISDIEVVSPEEKRKQASNFNNKIFAKPKCDKIHKMFEAVAKKYPNKTAVEFGRKKITYQELDYTADIIANFILANLRHKHNAIYLFLERGIDITAAILGILKSGNIFVPTDSSNPPNRIKKMFNLVRPELIVTNNENVNNIIDAATLFPQSRILMMDKTTYNFPESIRSNIFQFKEISQKISPNKKIVTPESKYAYIYFTSGSTGEPKAVLGLNKSIAEFIEWEIKTFKLKNSYRYAQLISPSFTVFMPDIFVPLCCGGTSCVPLDNSIIYTSRIIDWINKNQISFIHGVLAIFKIIAENTLNDRGLNNLRYITISGELVKNDKFLIDFMKKFGSRIKVVNLYGQAELTSTKIFHVINKGDLLKRKIPIGKTIDNARAIILNRHKKIIPAGMAGELYIRSPYLTAGYYNDSELTNKVFIQNPISDFPKDLVYKTGDLAKMYPDGNIEILGRVDDQIKVRGMRIEPGEIEANLKKYQGIKDAVIISHQDSKTQEYHLVAYYTTVNSRSIPAATLRSHLKSLLPDYIIPAYLVFLEKFPLNQNGKLDRLSLPAPTEAHLLKAEFEPPQTETEKKLAEIWQEVLNVKTISRYDNFFDLGGHSLKAIRVLSSLNQEFKIDLPLKHIFLKPCLIELANAISQAKPATQVIIPPAVKRDYYPLTHAQKRLWVLYQLEPLSAFYNAISVQELSGSFGLPALKEAFDRLLTRHDSLRANFKEIDGEPVQIIHPKIKADLKLLDLTKIKNRTIRRQEADRIIKLESKTPFNLESDRLIRITLLKIAPKKYTFMLVIHHIVIDQWSLRIFFRELATLYNSYQKGGKPSLPPLPIQYKDYSVWEQSEANERRLEKQEKYWLNHLAGELPILDLPVDKPRPPIQTYSGSLESITIDRSVLSKIRLLCQNKNTTLFTFLLTVFHVFLYRLTGQTDIIVGVTAVNRGYSEFENIMGIFLNNLAVRSDLSGHPSFNDLLEKIKSLVLQSFANSEYPVDRLIEKLNPARDLSRPPLYSVVFQVDEKIEAKFDLAGTIIKPGLITIDTAKIDLKFIFQERTDGFLFFACQYNTDLYNQETIARFLSIMSVLLKEVVKNPAAEIGQINILEPSEQRELLREFTKPKAGYPEGKTVVRLFEAQVKKTPGKAAIECDGKTMTYGELSRRVDQLSGFLKSRKITQNQPIAVYLDRSIQTAISLLAILKAGAVYLPIDISYPKQRITRILASAKPQLMITLKSLRMKLPHIKPNGVICLDIDRKKIEQVQKLKIGATVKLSDPACIIYTSGSTGEPKGAVLAHRGIVNYVHTKINAAKARGHKLDHNDIFCQNSPAGYIVSLWQLLTPLMLGARSIIYPDNITKDPVAFFEKINKDKVTLAQVVPSYLHAFLDITSKNSQNRQWSNLKELQLTGEAATPALVNSFYGKYRTPLVNVYGNSENSDDVLYYQVPHNTNTTKVFSGQPFNTAVYILNRYLRLQPIGIPGELYISGDGLARGYLNDPKRTKEVFPLHPFKKGERIYKTGDMAKMHPDGNIEILGRADSQIKIRGNRIEPGEVEVALTRYPGIKRCLVVSSLDTAQQSYLIAYYLAVKPIEADKLKDHLKKILSDFMVPDYYIYLKTFPLNVHGKLDRLSLPAPTEAHLLKAEFEPPQTETEKKLAEIWQEVLNVKTISRYDNFFDLGGHSLKAIRLLGKINEDFKISFPLSQIFRAATIEQISANINEQLADIIQSKKIKITKAEAKPFYKLSREQMRIWGAEAEKSVSGFHAPFIFDFTGDINIALLEKAFQKMVDKHEIFRTVFKEIKINSRIFPVQFIKKGCRLKIEYIDLDGLKPNKKNESIAVVIKNESRHGFDIKKDLLLRVTAIKIKNYEYKLLVKVHSVIFDAWSAGIFWKEFQNIFYNLGNNNKRKTDQATLAYKDYSEWQNSDEFTVLSDKHGEFWHRELSEGTSNISLPYDNLPQKGRTIERVGSVSSILDDDTIKAIKKICRELNMTYFVFFSGAYLLFLNRISKEKVIITNTYLSNRVIPDLQNIIGPIFNNLPIKCKIDYNIKVKKFFARIKENIHNFQGNNFFYDYYQIENLINQKREIQGSLFNTHMVITGRDDAIYKNQEKRSIQMKADSLSYKSYESLYDLAFDVLYSTDKITISFIYKSSLFKEGTMKKFIREINRIINKISRSRNLSIRDI